MRVSIHPMDTPHVVPPAGPVVPFSHVMSKVGYFLLNWSTLELGLSEAICEGRPADAGVSGTFDARLQRWRKAARLRPGSQGSPELVAQIAERASSLRKIRNLIVHGLIGGNSMPETGPGYIECAVGGYDRPTGKVVRYTIDQLEDFAQAADACRRGFRQVESFNHYFP